MGTPKKIMEKLQDISDKAASDTTFATTLSDLAVDAIVKGAGSAEWEIYMKKIVGANAPRQLARLTFKEPGTQNDPWLKRNATYIVSNAVCGPGTRTQTKAKVEANIDNNLLPEL